MPARPTRLGELALHSTRATAGRPPDLARALRLHPDWPVCDHCRYPIDPATGGGHPTCEEAR